jgi:hypothetical protein
MTPADVMISARSIVALFQTGSTAPTRASAGRSLAWAAFFSRVVRSSLATSTISTLTPVSFSYFAAIAAKPPPWLASPERKNCSVPTEAGSPEPPESPQAAVRPTTAAPVSPPMRI